MDIQMMITEINATRKMFETRINRLAQTCDNTTSELSIANEKINRLQSFCISNGLEIPFWDSNHPPSSEVLTMDALSASTAVACANYLFDDNYNYEGVDNNTEKDIFAQNLDFIPVPHEDYEYQDDQHVVEVNNESTFYSDATYRTENYEYNSPIAIDNNDESATVETNTTTNTTNEYSIERGILTTTTVVITTFNTATTITTNTTTIITKTYDDIEAKIKDEGEYDEVYYDQKYDDEKYGGEAEYEGEAEYDEDFEDEYEENKHKNYVCHCCYAN